MPSRKAISTFRGILESATAIFIDRGYRRTKMEDITQDLGLSAGSIYRYVESKEALFDAALKANAREGLDFESLNFPLPTPSETDMLQGLDQIANLEARLPSLFSTNNTPFNVEDMLAELFAELHEGRYALKLVETSTLDWPDLASAWYDQIRQRVLDQLASRLGQANLGLSPEILARYVIATVSYFAVHRYFDPAPLEMSVESARSAAIDLVNTTITHLPQTQILEIGEQS